LGGAERGKRGRRGGEDQAGGGAQLQVAQQPNAVLMKQHRPGGESLSPTTEGSIPRDMGLCLCFGGWEKSTGESRESVLSTRTLWKGKGSRLGDEYTVNVRCGDKGALGRGDQENHSFKDKE